MITGLSIDDLAIARGDRTLFEGLSFRVAPGEAIALVGANGSGKTSLLRCVAGFIRPAAGTIDFDGLDADEARRSGLHFLGHLDGLKGARTARDELAFQVQWTGGEGADVDRVVELLGLSPLLDLEVRKLSAGQRRRLALARLAASQRPLWLLDEPMAPLDTQRRALFGRMMGEHLATGGMILAAVHDPLPVAARTVEIPA
jgi:heme exporter protein A